MHPTRCLYNNRAALRGVLVRPVPALVLEPSIASRAISQTSPCLGATAATAWRGHSPRHAPATLQPSQRRHYAIPRGRRPNKNDRAQPDRLPQDLEIRERKIMIIGEKGDLSGPYVPRQVLDKIDLKTQSLRMVRPRLTPDALEKKAKREQGRVGNGNDPGDESGPPRGRADASAATAATTTATTIDPSSTEALAICKVVDKQAERKRETQRAKEKRAKERLAGKHKEVEINWAIADHDLGIKMGKMRGFLEKGYQVDVLLAKKKGARQAAKNDMEAIVKKVRDTVDAVPGTSDRKACEGTVGNTMKFYLQGTVPKS